MAIPIAAVSIMIMIDCYTRKLLPDSEVVHSVFNPTYEPESCVGELYIIAYEYSSGKRHNILRLDHSRSRVRIQRRFINETSYT